MTFGRRAVALALLVVLTSLSMVPAGAGGFGVVGSDDRPVPAGPSAEPQGGVVLDASPLPSGSNFSAVHEAGVTGEGVQVGVLGTSFDADHPALGDAVAGTGRFADTPLRLGGGSHDTAVAEVVAETAPQAEIYLAEVGPRPSAEEYARAVDWLLARDVDVIVDAASYFPATGEGLDRLNAVASEATDAGVVFVTSAGNYADRHWAGQAGGQGFVEFEPGTQANPLGDGPVSGQVALRLYWSSAADYDLYLYRYRESGDHTVVAKSTGRQSGSGDHAEAIDVTVPRGKYFVAVYAQGGEANASRLDLFAANHRLQYTVAGGSMVAPATARGVIAVGAASDGGYRPYSSRGNTLDLAAPDGANTSVRGVFYGSSASASVVAGTAALMEQGPGDLSPAETRHILQATATGSAEAPRLEPIEAVRRANRGLLDPTERDERVDPPRSGTARTWLHTNRSADTAEPLLTAAESAYTLHTASHPVSVR